MLELNKVMLIGNLTRDPELSYLPSGTALAKLGLALNRRFKGRDGEWREETSFIDVEAWGATAEFCSKWLKKGRRVFVEGRLKQDRWETPDGSKRSRLLVSSERIQFADSRQDDASGGQRNYDDAPPSEEPPAPVRTAPAGGGDAFPDAQDDAGNDTDDDLPF